MSEQHNLTPENVEGLRQQLETMKLKNPDLTYRFFEEPEREQPESLSISERIFAKLEELERKINYIFDGHVLIDGKFTKIQA